MQNGIYLESRIGPEHWGQEKCSFGSLIYIYLCVVYTTQKNVKGIKVGWSVLVMCRPCIRPQRLLTILSKAYVFEQSSPWTWADPREDECEINQIKMKGSTSNYMVPEVPSNAYMDHFHSFCESKQGTWNSLGDMKHIHHVSPNDRRFRGWWSAFRRHVINNISQGHCLVGNLELVIFEVHETIS